MAKVRTFDYVLVGAGSARCVLANRLTEGSDVSVLRWDPSTMPRRSSTVSCRMDRDRKASQQREG